MGRSARTNPHPDLFAGLDAAGEPDQPARPAPGEPRAGGAGVDTPADVPVDVPADEPVDATAARRARDPVWMCVYFPSLPLQALQDRFDSARAGVVCEPDQRKTIVATNRKARDAGVLPGQALKSALALCADLDIVDREPARETALLARIGERLTGFSTLVSLQPPQSVLVELRGSLRLFGGIDALSERLLGGLRADGYHLRHSIAPTATAAHWLALAGCCPSADAVVAAGRKAGQFLQLLNSLDIAVTGWPQPVIAALHEMGVDSIADCRRLPRDGLTRRFGPALLRSLAQAFGELPEARRHVRERQRFDEVLQLDAEIDDAAQLHTGCTRLLAQLEAFLRQHQGAVRRLDFGFHGWRGGAGSLTLSLSAAGFELQHWRGLLAAHLERCRLSQPAVAITLHADISEPLQARTATLSLEHDTQASRPADSADLHALLDCLQARIGEDSVRALRHVSEHRPEYASLMVSAAQDETHAAVRDAELPADWLLRDVPAGVMALTEQHALLLQRPLWLTEAPVPLQLRDGVLYSDGALQLRHGPERIESGWWEDNDATRDYFVAENPAGVRLWVFREPDATGAARWWLHGVFG